MQHLSVIDEKQIRPWALVKMGVNAISLSRSHNILFYENHKRTVLPFYQKKKIIIVDFNQKMHDIADR
jgi:3-isopropylmalate dehydratase small subunit